MCAVRTHLARLLSRHGVSAGVDDAARGRRASLPRRRPFPAAADVRDAETLPQATRPTLRQRRNLVGQRLRLVADPLQSPAAHAENQKYQQLLAGRRPHCRRIRRKVRALQNKTVRPKFHLPVCRRIRLIRQPNDEMSPDFLNEMYRWALECKSSCFILYPTSRFQPFYHRSLVAFFKATLNALQTS